MKTKLILVEYFFVPKQDKKTRLSDFVPGIFATISSKKGMKKAIDKGLVKINGERAYTADYIEGGETIELYQQEISNKLPVIDVKLEVLFEDDYLALVHKPPGIEVSGNKKWVLENAFPNLLKPSSQKDALQRPQAIHRLDFPTSGILLVGKTSQTVMALNKLFEERNVKKTYHGVCIGEMEDSGIIQSDIDGKNSKSTYHVLKKVPSVRFNFLNLVELLPLTGRKHQLRKHMAKLGNPILGDATYGKEELILKGKGLYLHASSLNFKHPFTGEQLCIAAPLPKKFTKIFEA